MSWASFWNCWDLRRTFCCLQRMVMNCRVPTTSRLLNVGGFLGWTEQGFGRFPCHWGSVSQGHVMGTQKRDMNQQIFLDCRMQMPRGHPPCPALPSSHGAIPSATGIARSHLEPITHWWQGAGVGPALRGLPAHACSQLGLRAVTGRGWLSAPLAWGWAPLGAGRCKLSASALQAASRALSVTSSRSQSHCGGCPANPSPRSLPAMEAV